MRQSWSVAIGLLAFGALAGDTAAPFEQSRVSFSADDVKIISTLSLSQLRPLPRDPGNRVADDPRAAELGQVLFTDERLSASGTVSCASCHVPERGFDDGAMPGQGIGVTTRRAMSLAGASQSPWYFWDGRADSQWAQALGPIENAGEQAMSRLAVARFIAEHYPAEYGSLFGRLPDLGKLPNAAGPFGDADEQKAWASLTADQQHSVNIVFANVGKAVAAFERTITPHRSRFDDFADALAVGSTSTALSTKEQRGLALFIGKALCTQCHNGPLLSDQFFHNTGVPLAQGLPLDLGRLPALKQLDADPFNCLGIYSDAVADQCGELRFKSTADGLLRAFKTPSLRAVGRRAPYMHAGQFADLESVVRHYSAAPWAEIGVTEVHRSNLTEEEIGDLVSFLQAL